MDHAPPAVTAKVIVQRKSKENSYRAYDVVINQIQKAPFHQKLIWQNKPFDARIWKPQSS